jgi:hypothetical protein
VGLIICPTCDHQRELKPLKRAKFKCSNCGCRAPRLVRRTKHWMRMGDHQGFPLAEAQRRTYAGLLWFAQSRGYKIGWASVKYRVLFGDWPAHTLIVDIEPPSAELIKWMTKQQQEYARMQRKKERAELLTPSFARAQSPLMNEGDWEVRL